MHLSIHPAACVRVAADFEQRRLGRCEWHLIGSFLDFMFTLTHWTSLDDCCIVGIRNYSPCDAQRTVYGFIHLYTYTLTLTRQHVCTWQCIRHYKACIRQHLCVHVHVSVCKGGCSFIHGADLAANLKQCKLGS